MKLTRLELSGFKSFADSISLPFEEGMTCIVGPNGCGKSNVSDAVRWVLGEQRARMLRGAKMEEVIFQGSLKRKPLNISEVSLCFDNSDGTLPIAYQEVVVTRRLSRNGQSDYLINQAPARLKDVQDLLRGTGLGGDAGVVIEAKMIDRLLSDRPDERRSLFEEAAGIGLYRDRKTTTERRLEKTSEDLIRLDDLISEVQTQVRSLARQRGKAQRHRQFSQERFSIVIELTRRQLKEFEHVRSTSAERHAELERIMPETREAITAREREREAAVQHRATAEAQRREAARRLSERRVEVEKIEGDLNLAKERLQNATQRMSRAGVEREEAERRASQAQLEHEAAGEERQAANRDRESVQGELDLRSASEDETRARLKTKRDRVRELEHQLQQAAETLRAKTGEESALKAEIEDLRGQLSEIEQRRVEAGQALEEASEFLASLSRHLESLEDEDRATQARLEQARHSVANARENETAILAEKRANEERHTQLSTRCEALEDLERERAGLAPAVKTLLAARAQFGDGAVLGPLSDFLQTDSDQAARAERLLGDWLHAVLVRDDATVSAIRSWHASTEPGPLALLPVHPGPSAPGRESAALQIDAEGPARLWVHALLGGSSALDETGTAIRQANGAILLTGTRDGRGPLARRAELNKLKTQLTDTTAAVERLTQSAAAATQAFTSAEENLRTAGEKAEGSRRQVAETRGEVDNLGRERQRIERDCKEKDESIARLRTRLDDRESRVQQLGVETNEANRSRAQLEADLESERLQLGRVEGEQETARERRVHWQVEEAQVSAREAAALDRESRAAEAYLESTEEMERLAKEITEIETTSAALKEQVAAWTDRVAECRVEVSELETATEQAESGVAEADAKIADAEQRLETARHHLEQATEQFHRLELQETELAGRRQALLERIEVEFHRPYDELEKESESVEGETAVLKEEEERLAAAIEQLGPVNPLAAQEYDEESTRLNFLETQREDLVDAQNSLRNALKEIDATARQLFDETFNEIRGNFQRVFETLFDGGECDVRLTDTDDPLDADIEIRAAPRGKRTQRIHLLSSGERALVAISLLFAIYLSKPSPFCLLDEVDAPLDDANVQRFIRLLTEFKVDTQFIVITHNPRTMQVADAVYGVTMQEPGVSTIVGVRLGEHQHA